MWYYATVLYFGNYYHKDPREMADLAASVIAVNTYEVKKQELMAKNEQLRALLHSMQFYTIQLSQIKDSEYDKFILVIS
ncbi:hypothetical protein GIB67_042629 [Kingdonia uniflora]|uniref:Uncharacterized protein n=1 Tax=Kingdonia uniflora TaxID=39325 RepID=A0A7J7M1I4_9MAGN|nr:hypothetical protein GIB67_042629 [Kingdonia uniflora]